MVVLRTVISGDPTFREFLGSTRSVANAAFAHSNIPFDKLVEVLQPARSPSYNPVFQVGYQYQVGLATEHHGASLDFTLIPRETDSAKFDLTLSVVELSDDLAIGFEYSTDLFEAESAGRILGCLRTLLGSVIANPDQTIRHLSILDEAERWKLLFGWNATVTRAPAHVSLPQMFEAQVERSPDATALVSDAETLSYRMLNERANQLAHYLLRRGVTSGSRIPIFMERSTNMIVAVLGVLKAGAVYVPLDPAYPKDRLAFMLEDVAAPVLLTQSGLLDLLPTYEGTVIRLDTTDLNAEAQPIVNCRAVSAASLAYVIYTSGSTGRPKGVMLRHHGLANLVLAQSQAFGVAPGRHVLQFASLSFDAAISEIGMALATGATLHVVGQEVVGRMDMLTECLQVRAIDIATLPPSVLAVLDPQHLPRLRTVISAGEACTWDIVQRWCEGREFFNAYGPTEATVGPTFYKAGAPGRQSGTVPIGRPIANVQIYVLDSSLLPVPVGVPGEIFIGGVGVASGYHNNAELTAERFIPNPFVSDQNCRLYRSGDLGRFLPDGNLEFLGRIDHQVKIRGFRIEPGEVEAAIASHPQVREVVALAIGSDADRSLAACVVASDELAALPLRSYLQQHLPAYMLPSIVLFMDRFPLTPNGKVDREALRMRASEIGCMRNDVVAPRSASERLVSSAFSEVLGRDQIGVLDDFFQLGGHSLMAARLITRVRALSGHDVSLRDLFEHPTVEGLAAVVDAFRWTASAPSAADESAGEREELEL